MTTALELYIETWEKLKDDKNTTQHQLAVYISALGKKVVGVQRWKEALIKIPAEIVKTLIGLGAAASTVPGLSAVVSVMTTPITDKGSEWLIEQWIKSDTKLDKTDLKLKDGFKLSKHKTATEAMTSLPKHIAQFVDSHKSFHEALLTAEKKLNDAKGAGVKSEDLNLIFKQLFLSFHMMRWTALKVSRDYNNTRAALDVIDKMLKANGEWMEDQALAMIKITNGYLR